MREIIETEMDKIIGLKLRSAGRASNLFWLEIGELISITRRGKTEEVGEYALHIQCAWRITEGYKILVASHDFYLPHSEWEDQETEFDWDVQGNNRFDERIAALINDIEEKFIITAIEPDHLGGFKLQLGETHILEVFPNSSDDDEYSEFWRLFKRDGDSGHFVVSGEGAGYF